MLSADVWNVVCAAWKYGLLLCLAYYVALISEMGLYKVTRLLFLCCFGMIGIFVSFHMCAMIVVLRSSVYSCVI